MQKLVRNWVWRREQIRDYRLDLVRVRKEVQEMAEEALDARTAACECAKGWRSLASAKKSREELTKVNRVIRRRPWLRAGAS